MKQVKRVIVDMLASGFRSGYVPIASGTFGTLVAIPFVVLLRVYASELAYVIVLAALLPISFYIAHKAEELYNEPDSSKIVIDEIVGYFVTCAFLPVIRWDLFVVAFFVFRFFDIFKLWPAIYFERRKGGIPVVMDDVCAGIYSNIVVQVYYYLSVVIFVTFKVGEV